MVASQYEIRPQVGTLAAAAVTASTAGTAITLVTLARQCRLFVFTNTLDTDVMLTYGGADMLPVPAGQPVALDLTSDNQYAAAGVVVGVYYTGSAPSTGSIGVGCF